MKTSFFLSAVLSLSFLVTGCGSPSDDSSNKSEIEDRQRIIRKMQPVVGTYRGVVVNEATGADPFPIEIKLFIVEESVGQNNKGETIFRPTLKGRYKRLDYPDDIGTEKTLSARFYEETQEITMVTPNGVEPYISVTCAYANRTLTGQIFNSRGLLGNFQITRSSDATDVVEP